MRIMVVDPKGDLPQGLEPCLALCGWTVVALRDYVHAAAELTAKPFDALVSSSPDQNEGGGRRDEFQQLVQVAEMRRLGGVIVARGEEPGVISRPAILNRVDANTRPEQIRDYLSAAAGYRMLLKSMEEELDRLNFMGERLREHFHEVDQEMQLAGRLQRDFLPRNLEALRPARFGAIFRPVSWVSGDIYDVFRVDERHLGFYIADAVGHGMAASLLTMFIKQAVVPKRIDGDDYVILEPSETLRVLNEALSSQELPNSQFVTACYGLFNTHTRELKFARGGHTYPVLLKSEGALTELKTEGPLMGLFSGQTFPTGSVVLSPGDKVVLYTDGLEAALTLPLGPASALSEDGLPLHVAALQELGQRSLSEMLAALETRLNNVAGSLHPMDDITVLALELDSAQ